jgi:hypothetical protein
MGGGRRGRGLGLFVTGWLTSGCMMMPPEDAQERLEALRTEQERMTAALDTVETRLLWSQSQVRFWQEMKWRHQQVSALQCRVSEQHLQGMAQHLEKQEQRARELRRRRQLAASAREATVLTAGKKESRISN